MVAGALKGERKKRENKKREMGVDGPKRQTVAHQRREGMKNGRFVFFLFCSLFLSRPVCCFFVDFFLAVSSLCFCCLFPTKIPFHDNSFVIALPAKGDPVPKSRPGPLKIAD